MVCEFGFLYDKKKERLEKSALNNEHKNGDKLKEEKLRNLRFDSPYNYIGLTEHR